LSDAKNLGPCVMTEVLCSLRAMTVRSGVVLLDADRHDALKESDLLGGVRHAPYSGERVPDVLQDDEQLLRKHAPIAGLRGHVAECGTEVVAARGRATYCASARATASMVSFARTFGPGLESSAIIINWSWSAARGSGGVVLRARRRMSLACTR